MWSALAILVASLITGLLLSLHGQTLGLPFLLFFAVAAVVVTLLVEARGLFLTVATGPILFVFFTVLASWLVTQSQTVEGSDPFSTTAILASVYPLTQRFPWLFWVTIICVIIAVLRLWLLRRATRRAENAERARRRRVAEAERVNRDQYANARARTARPSRRAREREERVTVQELMERNRLSEKRDLPGH